MKPSKAVEEIALRLTEKLQADLRTQGSELPLGAGRELQLGVERELTTLEARVRGEEREKIWSWAINNGITHKKSFVALRDYINSINTKEG